MDPITYTTCCIWLLLPKVTVQIDGTELLTKYFIRNTTLLQGQANSFGSKQAQLLPSWMPHDVRQTCLLLMTARHISETVRCTWSWSLTTEFISSDHVHKTSLMALALCHVAFPKQQPWTVDTSGLAPGICAADTQLWATICSPQQKRPKPCFSSF